MMLFRLLVIIAAIFGCMVVLAVAVLSVLRDLLDRNDHDPPGMQNLDAM